MAAAGRIESQLPLLKCSTCGEEIDIMSLADHVCQPITKPAVGNNTSQLAREDNVIKGDPAVQSDASLLSVDPAVQQGPKFLDVQQQPASGFLKPGRLAPAQIDSAAANRPFLQPEAAITPGSDYSNYTNEQGLTPVTPSTQITTPSSMFSRKQSYPSRSPSPPSPNYGANIESRFAPVQSRPDGRYLRSPPSPGANVIQRMNGAADGPFSSQRNRSNSQKATIEKQPLQGSYNPYASIAQQDPYSTVASVQPSQTSGFDGGDSLQREHPAEKPRRVVDSIDMFLCDADEVPPERLSPEQRSKTFPETTNNLPQTNPYFGFSSPAVSAAPLKTGFSPPRNRRPEEQRPTTSAGPGAGRPQPNTRFDAFKDPTIHNPFIPASRQRVPSIDTSDPRSTDRLAPITDANSPDNDPKSPWFEAPRPSPLPPNVLSKSQSLSGRARSKTQSRPNEPTAVERFLNNQPPAPSRPVQNLRREGSSARSDISHSPSGSASSYASSQSTTPSSVGSSLSRNASSDSTRGDRRGISRSDRPEPLPQPSMPAVKVPQPLESPVDPSVHHMRAPRDPAIQLGIGPRSLMSDSPPRARQPSKPDIYAAAPPRFQQPVSKGECRGCGTHIYGKSVKAADGRLTGRYHKSCFVCKTCQAPFPTAEFYVHGDAPYCSQHYHELNGSLCRKCNKGIEGQYTETDQKEKFHSHCFCCAHCRVRLDMDYYELGGIPYCERHALAIPRQRNAPFAEKRRTRMGFMEPFNTAVSPRPGPPMALRGAAMNWNLGAAMR